MRPLRPFASTFPLTGPHLWRLFVVRITAQRAPGEDTALLWVGLEMENARRVQKDLVAYPTSMRGNSPGGGEKKTEIGNPSCSEM